MRKYILYGAPLFLILIGGGYYFFVGKEDTPAATNIIIPIQSGSISETVKATGKVYPLQDSVLSFSHQGVVTHIYKKVGDTVKAGEVIAQVDAKSAELDVASARLNLSNAQNNYNKIVGDAGNTDKIRAQNTLDESNAKLILLEKNLDDLRFSHQNAETSALENIKSLESKVTIAKNDLEYTSGTLTPLNSTNTLEKDLSNAFATVTDVYRTLSTLNTQVADTLTINSIGQVTSPDLGGSDTNVRYRLEDYYTGITQAFDDYELKVQQAQTGSGKDFDVIMSLANDANNILIEYDSFLARAIQAVDSSYNTPSFSTQKQQNMKSSLQSYAGTISTKETSITTTITTLNTYGSDDLQALQDKNTILQKQNTLVQAKNDLTKANMNYAELQRSNASDILQAEQNIDSQKNTIKLNEASLHDLINPDGSDVVSARNSIRSAQISLDKANLTLADYQIRAPFDGKILDIPWSEGITSLSTEGITMANDNAYEVQVLLDQIDVVKVQPGMLVRVQLDPFPNLTLTGTISSVSGAPIESSSVVSYTARILLPGIEKQVFSDMTATVEIVIVERNDAIVLNSSAVHTQGDLSFVMIEGTDGSMERRPVVVGITSGSKTEIISGLSIGDRVFIGTANTTSSSSRGSSGSTNSFRVPGVTGGGTRGGSNFTGPPSGGF